MITPNWYKYQVKEGESGIVDIPLPEKWRYHRDPNVDLAVLPWTGIAAENATVNFLPFDKIAQTPAYLRAKGNQWPPSEGQDTFMVACMTQYYGKQRNFPIVRRGNISLITDELVQGEYGLSHYHFVEGQIYPGHSGAPVWVRYGDTLYLLGVLAAGHPVEQELLVPKQGILETKAYYNLGISLVVPTAKLTELLTSEELQEMRKRDEPKPIKPIPVGIAPPERDFTKADFEAALKKVSRKTKASEPDEGTS